MRRITFAAIAVALSGFLSQSARAESILIQSGPVVTPIVGGFHWDYVVENVGSTKEVKAGDFFAIVDFSGYIAGSIFAPADWVATTPPVVGLPDVNVPGNFFIVGTSSAQTASVPNNPGVPDLLFQYVGTTPLTGTLGHFGADSIYGRTVLGNLVAQDSFRGDVLTAVNTDSPLVPVAPLPAAAWAGFALFGGLGLKKLRRRGEVLAA